MKDSLSLPAARAFVDVVALAKVGQVNCLNHLPQFEKELSGSGP